MQHHHLLALAIVLALHTPPSHAVTDQLDLNLCLINKTVGVQIYTNQSQYESSATCQCQVGAPTSPSNIRDDYVHTPGIGSHKFHTNAKNWNDARKVCNNEGGHLAIINSFEEEAVLLKLFLASRRLITNTQNVDIVSLGIHDLYTEGDWVTILGEPMASTGYAHWSPNYCCNQPDNKNGQQHCGALTYLGGLDDTECFNTHSFFCELPIGCEK